MSLGYASFIPTTNPLMGHSYYENPAWRVDIEATLHDQLIHTDIENWTPTVSDDKKVYTESGANLVYCNPKSGNNTLTLTHSITIPEKGDYRIFLRLKKGAGENGNNSSLTVDGHTYYFNTWQEYTMINRVDLGKQRLKSGIIDLTLTLQKWTNVEQVIIQRVIPMSTDNVHGSRRLKINNTDFTQNNISDMNTFSLNTDAIPSAWPNGHYYKNNQIFNLVYDFGSNITISMGEDKNKLIPTFGGYITKVGYNPNEGTFNLSGPDRLYDLIREPSYYNNIVGAATSTQDKKDYPYISLGDIYSAGQYVAQTIEYPIRTDQIHYNNLESSTEYSNRLNINLKPYNALNYMIGNYGFIPQRDTSTGYPAPGLKLTQGTKLGHAYFKVWSDASNPVKLSQFPILLFDYMAPNLTYNKGWSQGKNKPLKSKTFKSPLLFDIGMTIYKKNETSSNAKTYYIPFSSQERQSQSLCSPYQYICNGEWHRFTMNIKALMDNYASSDEYYLTELFFVNYNNWNEIYYNTTLNEKYRIRKKYKAGKKKGKYYYVTKYKRVNKTERINRYMWFDNIMTTTEEAVAKSKSEDDISTSFEFLQKTADDTNHSIWVMPGLERKDDALYIAPNGAEVIDTEAITGTNILNITDINNAPQENICNQSTKRYNIDDDNTATTYYGDREHSIHYGPIEKYEVQSDNNSGLVAYLNAKYQVEDNLVPGWAFTMDIKGSSNLPINQYINTKTPHIPWLNGQHKIVSVEQFIDNNEDTMIKSSIGCNQASKRYKLLVKNMQKELRREAIKNRLNLTVNQRIKTVGNNSPGATI